MTAATAPAASGFRPDIQGLRAIAVGLVLLYHAAVPPFTGGYIGVDVFFVISGFLISSHLLQAIEQDGRIHFTRFYARRARRILPASFAVVVLTSIALVFTAPALSLSEMLWDAVATMLYVPNIRFALQDTDYLADHSASAFQHYWSLGVEEQFYLLWPLLLLGIALLARRRRGMTILGIAVVTAMSFAACVSLTQTDQPFAFFLLHARAWELLAGAIVAATVRGRVPRVPAWAAAAGGWVGVAAIVAGGLVFDDATPFPGTAAALPVLGTVAVIFFGTVPSSAGPGTVLSVRPMQFVGLISYSLYLVHWPLLMVPRIALGDGERLPLWATVLLGIVLALPLAWLLYRFVEDPFRALPALIRHRPRVTLISMGVITAALAGALALGAVWADARQIAGSGDAAAAPATPVAPPPVATIVPANLTPSLRDVADDIPDVYADGCHHDTDRTSVQQCVYGQPGAGFRVALFGDSHAAQWLPALQSISGAGRPMAISTYTKSSCPAVEVTVLVKNIPYASCDEWRAAVLEHLRDDPPDLVVISSYAFYPLQGGPEGPTRLNEWGEGLSSTVEALRATGSDVLVVADTPRFGTMPSECVSAHLTDVDACASDPAIVLDAGIHATEQRVTEAAGGRFADLTPYICTSDTCPVVIFDMLVYRDVNHLTTRFVAYLAPALAPAIPESG